jgi:hypothetical protein
MGLDACLRACDCVSGQVRVWALLGGCVFVG